MVVILGVLTLSCTSASDSSMEARNPTAPPMQRCMNMSNALEAAWEGEWGYTVRFEDIDRLKAAGFDTIRLPVRWSAHAGNWGRYKLSKKMLKRTDAIIDHALAQDMKVILNVHHYYELNKEPSLHERRLEAIWRQLAEHYEGYPEELIFEVLNEPHGKMTPERTDSLNKRIVSHIRKSQPMRWIVLATPDWATLNGLLSSTPPKASRIILSWHYYEPFNFTHQGARFFKPTPPVGTAWGSDADMQRLTEDFRKAVEYRDTYKLPLLIGEFGAYDEAAVEDRARWIGAVRRLAEENDFGWCHWGLSSNFRVYDAEKEEWIEPIRAALLDD